MARGVGHGLQNFAPGDIAGILRTLMTART